MMNETISKIKAFANHFNATILNGTSDASGDYKWEIYYNYGLLGGLHKKYFRTTLYLLGDDEQRIGSITYKIVKEHNQYSYFVVGEFQGEEFDYDKDKDRFEEFVDVVDECASQLFDEICTYLHRYTMERTYIGKAVDGKEPPIYKRSYCPWRITNFMDRYNISPFVNIDVEVVDKSGMSTKHYAIDNLYFNDESNELIISLKE